jgi:hypothetical protein
LKALGCIFAALALLVIAGGALAIANDFPGGSGARGSIPTSSPAPTSDTTTAQAEQSDTAQAQAEDTGSTATQEPASPGGGTPTPVVSDVQVGQPALELATFPLASVEATYTESHQFGSITVRFRPGAYSADYAAEIARLTEEALAEANAKLQEQWTGDLTVFLADQLFAADCLGCQGFTESDFRWVFMLDDGSVVPDEFEALLVHEVTHLIAGNTIHLPFDTFYVEGLATWVMTDDFLKHGYVTPLQSTAWVYEAGALPPLQQIMDDDFAGRMRKRVYYDAAAAFTFFVIDTYGWDAYVSLYRQNSLDAVLGKPLAEVETEWHLYLDPFRSETINGVGAPEWWDAATQVIDAYGRFYLDPGAFTSDQYRLLTLSRLALNRADAGNALQFLGQSGI